MGVRAEGIDKTSGRDARCGVVVNDEELRNPTTGAAPIAATATTIVAAVLPSSGDGTPQTHTIAAQPDLPRVLSATLTDADAGIGRVVVDIIGTDYWNNATKDQIVVTSATTVVGLVAFRSVSSVTTRTFGTVTAADRIAVGVAAPLGLPVRIGAAADVIAKREGGNVDTTGVINVEHSTWSPANAPNAARQFFCTIQSTYGNSTP